MPRDREWPERQAEVVEYRLGDEERRLLSRIVRAIEKKFGIEDTEKGLADLSTQSDKMEKDVKDLKDAVNTQTKGNK